MITATIATTMLALAAAARPVDGLLDLPQAAAAVRAFMGEPHLNLQWKGIDWDEPTGARNYSWPVYLLVERHGREVRRGWSVDPFSGEVVGFTDVEAHPFSAGHRQTRDEQGDFLPPSEMYNRCVDWLREHVPDFDPADFEPPPHATDPTAQYSRRTPLYSHMFKRSPSFEGVEQPLAELLAFAVYANKLTSAVCEYLRIPVGTFHFAKPTVEPAALERRAVRLLKQMDCVYVRLRSSFFATIENCSYPDTLAPVYRCILWRLDADRYNGTGVDYRPMVGMSVLDFHANTGELLAARHYDQTPGDDVFEFSDQDLAAFRAMPDDEEPLPWFMTVNDETAFSYPLPFEEDGRLYVRDRFAWLMGVRIYEEEDGTILLRGCEETRIAPTALRERHGVRYYPLEELARAADARMAQQPEERRLVIQVRYPRPMGETRDLPAPEAAD